MAVIEFNQKKSNGRGGKRSGAGRKPGAVTKKTREIADKANEQGITPLEVMLEAMRDVYKEGGALGAFNLAKEVAPFVHARLSSSKVDATVKSRTVDEAIEELNATLATGTQDR